jgi:hypothetical protein
VLPVHLAAVVALSPLSVAPGPHRATPLHCAEPSSTSALLRPPSTPLLERRGPRLHKPPTHYTAQSPLGMPSSIPSLHLLVLPQSLLRRVLLFLDADTARAVTHTCTMKAFKRAHQQASLQQFFSSLLTLLDDRELLSQDASARDRKFAVLGYKEGLDEMNTRAEEQGMMQVPFTQGFHEGARTGWRNAVASGRLAALACMLALEDERRAAADPRVTGKDALMNDESKQHVFRINQSVNSKLISIPLTGATGPSSSNDEPPPLEEASSIITQDAASALEQLGDVLQQAGLGAMRVDTNLDLPPVGNYKPEEAAAHPNPAAASSSSTPPSTRAAAKPATRPARQPSAAAAPLASVEASQMAALDW